MTKYTLEKGVRTEKVMMNPAMALKLLETASDNRNISTGHVAALEQMIRRGDWKLTHQGIAVGSDGKLYDGQHRLWAIIQSGMSVPVLITYGLANESRLAIDKGRKRSVSDELRMFRGYSNTVQLVGYVNLCANLSINDEGGSGGHRVSMQTLGIFEKWYDIFREGVDKSMLAVNAGAPLVIRRSHVGGALAFAYPTAPNKISAFLDKVRDGVGLEPKAPALVLRKFLLEHSLRNRAGIRIAPASITRKVLRAAMAEVKNEELSKFEETDKGVNYFRKHYKDNAALKTMVKPWTEAGAKASVPPGAALEKGLRKAAVKVSAGASAAVAAATARG